MTPYSNCSVRKGLVYQEHKPKLLQHGALEDARLQTEGITSPESLDISSGY
ncbi:MAG: hypothetical protein AABW46_03765 [Nanoarchaeota archaeon]